VQVAPPDRSAADGAALDFQYTVNTLGRLTTPSSSGRHCQDGEQGQVTRLRDVARLELEPRTRTRAARWTASLVGLAVFQLPGSNALATAIACWPRWRRSSTAFRKVWTTPSSTTPRRSSASRSTRSQGSAGRLRARGDRRSCSCRLAGTIIPLIAVPVSLWARSRDDACSASR